MRKASCEISVNGGIIRMKNKQIIFQVTDEKTMINFRMADSKPDVPACSHKCIKGKVRETFIQMSNGTMDAFVIAYMKHKNFLSIEFRNWKNAVEDNETDEATLYKQFLEEKRKNGEI